MTAGTTAPMRIATDTRAADFRFATRFGDDARLQRTRPAEAA